MAGEHDMAGGRAAGAPLRKRVARAAKIGIGRGIELNALADGKEIQVGVIDALAGAHRDRQNVYVGLAEDERQLSKLARQRRAGGRRHPDRARECIR